ncbi:DsrE family protein [Rhodoblastus sp.]|uniref:DsrE family protein n=1 Tax=Rhodoblastus sp. TaxID=1962975 RepID=UPI003F9E3D3C
MRWLQAVFILTLFCAAPAVAQDQAAPAMAQAESARDKVVYHIDDAAGQALKALRNIRNQMDVAPDTRIIVVAHGDGVDFLFDGARDPKSNVEFGPLIAGLKVQGVTFEVCEITMKRRNLGKERFVMEADYTPSGVVRISRLQTRDHFAYIKP